jgi:CxxC-x17-CxxC domain-containing protein
MPIKFLYCVSCQKEFIFTIAEQDYYKERSYEEPKRCSICRKNRKQLNSNRSNGSFHNNNSQDKSYNVKCFACGVDTRVNYRPSLLRPAFCNNCDKTRYRARRNG